VNAIPLFNGGTHIDAFRRGFHSGLLAALERESRKRKLLPNRADVGDGLLLYAVLEMAAPSYDSQSKSRLINEHVGARVRKLLDNPEFFRGVIKKHPQWIDSIYARCAERTQAKDSRDLKKQGKKNLRQKIEDLEDACGIDRSKCILFITEGKSAVAGITEARDANIQGALPMRGKILNVYGESTKTILANEALAKIMNSVGLIPGERVNRHSLRYGRVYLTCDADEDGKNISALLCNFFYNCWPELFDADKQPFIYIFETPLIIAVKGKQRKYWYSKNYGDFDPTRYSGWEVTRAKGLAALTKDDWRQILVEPQTVPIIDDGRLGETFRLLFSPDSKARKEWMGI
jgi:DNA gyrase/topoisomerase IV subunit B